MNTHAPAPWLRARPARAPVLVALLALGLGSACVVEVTPVHCGGHGEACCAFASCAAGLVCRAGVCQAPSAVCGGYAQPCCVGLTCASGLTCSVGVCVGGARRAVYEACAAGESCAGVAACMQASYSSTGAAGTFCTVGCTGSEQCPSTPVGAFRPPTCVLSPNTGSGLCYDTCYDDFDCSAGTTCARVDTVHGQVRICVPSGPLG